MQRKYKVGDKVKVIAPDCRHDLLDCKGVITKEWEPDNAICYVEIPGTLTGTVGLYPEELELARGGEHGE